MKKIKKEHDVIGPFKETTYLVLTKKTDNIWCSLVFIHARSRRYLDLAHFDGCSLDRFSIGLMVFTREKSNLPLNLSQSSAYNP
jgi:hypothetical protein